MKRPEVMSGRVWRWWWLGAGQEGVSCAGSSMHVLSMQDDGVQQDVILQGMCEGVLGCRLAAGMLGVLILWPPEFGGLPCGP